MQAVGSGAGRVGSATRAALEATGPGVVVGKSEGTRADCLDIAGARKAIGSIATWLGRLRANETAVEVVQERVCAKEYNLVQEYMVYTAMYAREMVEGIKGVEGLFEALSRLDIIMEYLKEIKREKPRSLKGARERVFSRAEESYMDEPGHINQTEDRVRIANDWIDEVNRGCFGKLDDSSVGLSDQGYVTLVHKRILRAHALLQLVRCILIVKDEKDDQEHHALRQLQAYHEEDRQGTGQEWLIEQYVVKQVRFNV